eukprot:maker-scaffold181_size278858-snap-gene-0.14 protein:Tk08507 transcript:maker-scaffold181_size278858-snap-gene-0.14-mRNA-1 annotation:"PREDICTED: uncharacterized protein K02A2.6-like"
MLRRLHMSHMGVVKTKRRARAAIWWPMIDRDINNLVERCALCQLTRASQPREPACMASAPDFPCGSGSIFAEREVFFGVRGPDVVLV